VTDPVRRVLVAGTAGGVGTTTITALLFSAWTGRAGAPRLADHTAGTLGRRLAEGDEVGRLDDGVVLSDAGAHAFDLGEELADPQVSLVLVTAATPVGCALAERCLDRLRGGPGVPALSQMTLATVTVFGRHRIAGRVQALSAEVPELAGVVHFPADPALAAGGRIPLARLGRGTREATEKLAGLIGGVRTVPGVRVSG
jgi:hypothetical protein